MKKMPLLNGALSNPSNANPAKASGTSPQQLPDFISGNTQNVALVLNLDYKNIISTRRI